MSEPGPDHNIGDLLSQILREVLEGRTIDWSQGFVANGGNSLSLIYFIAEIVRRCGIELTSAEVLEAVSLARLREELSARLDGGTHARPAADSAPAPFGGEVPLSANRYSYFDRRGRDFEYWILSPTLLRCHPGFDPEAMRRAVAVLVAHHHGLRLQLERGPEGWRQRIDAPDALEHFFEIRYPGRGDGAEFTAFVEATFARVYETFTFPGPLFKLLAIVPDAGGQPVVCMIAHHIVVDAFAIGVVLRDLNTLYMQITRGQPPQLPPPTMSFPEYVRDSTAYWSARRDVVDGWRTMPWDAVRELALVRPYADEHNIESHSISSVARTAELTRSELIGEGAEAPPDLLPMVLTALAKAYGEWSSHEVLLISVLFHGRENFRPGVDLSRTVGYLCDFSPLLLPTRPELGELWRIARRRVTEARISGKSYGVNRYLHPDPRVREEFGAHPLSQISLNIIPPHMRHSGDCDFGTLSGEFRRPPGTKPSTQRGFLLSAGVYHAEDHFCIAWDYSRLLFEQTRMDRFAEECLRHFLAVRALVKRGEAAAD